MIALNEAIKQLVIDIKEKIQPTAGYSFRPTVKKGLDNWLITDGPTIGILIFESEPEYFLDKSIDNNITLTIYGVAKANDDKYNNDKDIIALAEDCIHYFENDCIYKDAIDREGPITFDGPYSTTDGLVWSFSFKIKYTYNVLKANIND